MTVSQSPSASRAAGAPIALDCGGGAPKATASRTPSHGSTGVGAARLIDNFEWAEGFTKRFGLVHLDPDTLVRTPKASYRWYRDLIAANR